MAGTTWFKILVTALMWAGLALVDSINRDTAATLAGEFGASQMRDDSAAYLLGKVGPSMVPATVLWFCVGIVVILTLALWVKDLWRMIVPVTASLALCGCMRPYNAPQIIEITPSQTAFYVPLEGATGDNQAKFESVDMLKKAQVATKRITITQVWRKTGYWNTSGEYIPTARVIVVDRALVTREWKEPNDINIESVESIAFDLTILCNAMILEEDAAQFLYWYGGKKLVDIVDTNIRADVADKLAKAFGVMPINDCQENKGKILNQVREELAVLYKKRGITIETLGINGGLAYDDPKIQESINNEFISNNLKTLALNKQQEQNIMNQVKVSAADAEASAAISLANAKEAFQTVRQLEIDKIRAEKWDGKYPQFYITGSDGAGIPGMNFLQQLPAQQ